jgi:hypothetical protein
MAGKSRQTREIRAADGGNKLSKPERGVSPQEPALFVIEEIDVGGIDLVVIFPSTP